MLREAEDALCIDLFLSVDVVAGPSSAVGVDGVACAVSFAAERCTKMVANNKTVGFFQKEDDILFTCK